MFSFKKSLIALVGVLVIVVALATLMPLVGRGQGQAPFGPRKFYLTQTEHTGAQALTACAEGYHMASLWEILDPSNLRYDTQLGLTAADSGFGPPSGPNAEGWIRTGRLSSTGTVSGPGEANCLAWTSADELHRGTTVQLRVGWDSTFVTVVNPWLAGDVVCDNPTRVWCVQD